MRTLTEPTGVVAGPFQDCRSLSLFEDLSKCAEHLLDFLRWGTRELFSDIRWPQAGGCDQMLFRELQVSRELLDYEFGGRVPSVMLDVVKVLRRYRLAVLLSD